MGVEEQSYSHQALRPVSHNHILTPSSAVSSFNLPACCDSTLITPIQTTSSPTRQSSMTSMRDRMDVKLSPTTISPNYLALGEDNEFSRYNMSMKSRDSYGLNASTPDGAFPTSPVCPSPYFGNFSVSATPQSARTPQSSSSMHPSPNLLSAGGMSNLSNEGRNSCGPPTPALSAACYRPNSQTPILLAPNPSTFRPSTRHHNSPHHSPLQSSRSPPESEYARRDSFSSASSNSKVRKRPNRKSSNDAMYAWLLANAQLAEEEQILLEYKVLDKLPWKEIVRKFNERFGKDMKVAALQMRLNRLGQKHLDDPKQFSGNHGNGRSRWRRSSSESYDDGGLHPFQYVSESDAITIDSLADDQRVWSDFSSTGHSLPDLESANIYSTLSPHSSMDPRSRAASDASMRLHSSYSQQSHHQQQHHNSQQHRMMYAQPQQHHNNHWAHHGIPRSS